MITLVSRAECLRQSPVLAQFVRALQSAHDPATGYGSPEEVDPDAAAWFAAFRDDIPEAPSPPFAGSATLQLPAESLDALVAALPDAVARLLEALGEDSAMFLHLSRGARWPTRRRTPPQLADAARRFRAMGAGKGFNGGIQADRASLAEVLVPLFWSTRMDGDYGEVYFALGSAPVIASPCRYGNLHLEAYGEGWPERVREAAGAAGFDQLQGPQDCHERFGPGGRIEGRSFRV